MKISKKSFVKKYKQAKNCSTRTALLKWAKCLSRFGLDSSESFVDLQQSKFGVIGNGFPTVHYFTQNNMRTKMSLVQFRSRLDANRPWQNCFILKQISTQDPQQNVTKRIIFENDNSFFGYEAGYDTSPIVQIQERYLLASDVLDQEAINNTIRNNPNYFKNALIATLQNNGCLETINGVINFNMPNIPMIPQFDIEERICNNDCYPDRFIQTYCSSFLNFTPPGNNNMRNRFMHLTLFSEPRLASFDILNNTNVRANSRKYAPHFYHFTIDQRLITDFENRYQIPVVPNRNSYWSFFYDVIKQSFIFLPHPRNRIIRDLNNARRLRQEAQATAQRINSLLDCLERFFNNLIRIRNPHPPHYKRLPPYNVPHNPQNPNLPPPQIFLAVPSLDPQNACGIYLQAQNDILANTQM